MQKLIKLTVVVDVQPTEDEQGKKVWRASSPSIGVTADGDTPEAATEELKKFLVANEDGKFRVGKAIRFREELIDAAVNQPRKEEASSDADSVDEGVEADKEEVRSGDEGEEEAESEASEEAEAVTEEDLIELDSMKIAELRELANKHGVKHTDLGKVALRRKLQEVLG